MCLMKASLSTVPVMGTTFCTHPSRAGVGVGGKLLECLSLFQALGMPRPTPPHHPP